MKVSVRDLRPKLYGYLLEQKEYSHISDQLEEIASRAAKEISEQSRRYSEIPYKEWLEKGRLLAAGLADGVLKDFSKEVFIKIGSEREIVLKSLYNGYTLRITKERIECINKKRGVEGFCDVINHLVIDRDVDYLISLFLTLNISPKAKQDKAIHDTSRIITTVKNRAKNLGYVPLGHMKAVELNKKGDRFHIHVALFYAPETKEAIGDTASLGWKVKMLEYAHRVNERRYQYKRLWDWGQTNVRYRIVEFVEDGGGNKSDKKKNRSNETKETSKGTNQGNEQTETNSGVRLSKERKEEIPEERLESVWNGEGEIKKEYITVRKAIKGEDIDEVRSLTHYITKNVRNEAELIRMKRARKRLNGRFRFTSTFFIRTQKTNALYKYHKLPKYVKDKLPSNNIQPEKITKIEKQGDRYYVYAGYKVCIVNKDFVLIDKYDFYKKLRKERKQRALRKVTEYLTSKYKIINDKLAVIKSIQKGETVEATLAVA